MRNKALPIVICLILAAVFTLVINRGANQKYDQASKTVEVCAAANFIPNGNTINDGDIKMVTAPQSMKDELVTDKGNLIGKSLLTGAMPENKIYKNMVSDKTGIDPGYKSVGVQTNQASSDQVVAGDTVDVLVTRPQASNAAAPGDIVALNVKVIASYDQSGNIIVPGSSAGGGITSATKQRVPTMVELMVPDQIAPAIAGYAKNNQIYIVRR